MDLFYKQPEYYSRFMCTGGDCPINCCNGWNIHWTEDEFKKLQSAKKSDELSRFIDESFVEGEIQGHKTYEIVFGFDGFCQFVDRNTGLCMIQRELGEEYLGVVCTTYPRVYFQKNNIIMRHLQTSCAHVVEMLIKDPDAAKLVTVKAHGQNKIDTLVLQKDNETAVIKSPYLKYRFEICDFMADIFGFDTEFENIMVIGALCAKSISEAAMKNQSDMIPSILEKYKKQFVSADTRKSIAEIKSNYRIKFAVINNMLVQYLGERADILETVSHLHNGEELIAENYIKGKENFTECFHDRSYAIKNIVINLFYNIFIGLDFTEHSFMDLYSYFTACAATVQIIAYSEGFENKDIEKSFVKSVSGLGRCIIHNRIRANDILSHIKSLGLVTPAHLAMIIK